MTAVFVDTSFLIALVNPADRLYPAAAAQARQLHKPIVTTDYILVEFGNYVRAPVSRHLFPLALNLLRKDRHGVIVPTSSELLNDGITLFNARPDKAWSLTDCISFVVRRRKSIKVATSTQSAKGATHNSLGQRPR